MEQLTLIDMIIYGLVALAVVGFIAYRLMTDPDSIKDKDPTVMELLRAVQLMSSTEQARIRKGINNESFKDIEGGENDNDTT